MINKPIILSLIISLIFFFSLMVASSMNNDLYQLLVCSIVLFSSSLYIGKSHTRKFKEEMSKTNKIKISLYFFIFWFVFTSSIVILMVMNTTLKNIPLLSFTPKEIFILSKIFLMIFVNFAINSLLIYYAISLGSKLGLPKNRE